MKNGYNCDKSRTLKVGLLKNPHAGMSLTKAKPGGTRSGGMTPSSWQSGNGGGRKDKGAGRMNNGWPSQNGWIGW